jgi:hypothetical protein
MQNTKPVGRHSKNTISFSLSLGERTVHIPQQVVEEFVQLITPNSGKSDSQRRVLFDKLVQLFYKELSAYTERTINQTVEAAMNELLNKFSEKFATKEDLKNVENRLKEDINKVDLKIDQVEIRLNEKIDKVEAGLKEDIKTLGTSLEELIKSKAKWIFGILGVMFTFMIFILVVALMSNTHFISFMGQYKAVMP